MNPKSPILIAIFMASLLCTIIDVANCREYGIVTLKRFGCGFRSSHNSDVIENIARFAIQEHNKNSNSLLEFGRVLKAKEQVVAGKVYHLTLEAVDAGKKAVYEAKVWVKPWMNFKQLQEFKRAMDISHFTTSDLSVMRDGFRWHKVPIHDPEVRNAAIHAVRSIQNMINCLTSYELLDILQAEAQIVDDFVKYKLLLKLRRGSKEEERKVKVRKTSDGKYFLIMNEHLDM